LQFAMHFFPLLFLASAVSAASSAASGTNSSLTVTTDVDGSLIGKSAVDPVTATLNVTELRKRYESADNKESEVTGGSDSQTLDDDKAAKSGLLLPKYSKQHPHTTHDLAGSTVGGPNTNDSNDYDSEDVVDTTLSRDTELHSLSVTGGKGDSNASKFGKTKPIDINSPNKNS
jgi:phosphate-selective porin